MKAQILILKARTSRICWEFYRDKELKAPATLRGALPWMRRQPVA